MQCFSSSLCCDSYFSQWGWPELQRQPKQLLQSVLAPASVGFHKVDAGRPWCQLSQFKRPGCAHAFNWHTLPKRKKGESKKTNEPGRPDRNEIVEWPPKPLCRLVKADPFCHSFDRHENSLRCESPVETWRWSWRPWKVQGSHCPCAQLRTRWVNPQGLVVGLLSSHHAALFDPLIDCDVIGCHVHTGWLLTLREAEFQKSLRCARQHLYRFVLL